MEARQRRRPAPGTGPGQVGIGSGGESLRRAAAEQVVSACEMRRSRSSVAAAEFTLVFSQGCAVGLVVSVVVAIGVVVVMAVVGAG